jgi:hypothetical protein
MSTFPVVMPLSGEKELYEYIHTKKLIKIAITQLILTYLGSNSTSI